MDKYNRGRDSKQNEATIEKLGLVFAESFNFRAFNADGTPFGKVQGKYTPRSWIEANDVEKTFGKTHFHRGLFVPNYLHCLTVVTIGKEVQIEGYHEHAFEGADVRMVVGAARHLAFETMLFTKENGVWRVTEYAETNYNVSELNPPSLNRHGKKILPAKTK